MTIFEYVPSAVPKLNKINIYQEKNIYRNFQPNRRDLQIEKRETQTKTDRPDSTGVWSRLSNHFVIRIQHNRTHARRLPCPAIAAGASS